MKLKIFTEEQAKNANWPCRMCEYGPEKQHAIKPPKICHSCDSFAMFDTENTNNNHKPNNFELIKAYLIPSQPWGSTKIMTSWDCQKLRDKQK